MMRCDVAQELIHNYVDNELAASDAQALEEHLTECASCREEYDEVRSVVDSVRGAKPLYVVPEASENAARVLLYAGLTSRKRQRYLAVAAAVLMVVGLSLAVLLLRPESGEIEFTAFAAGRHLRYAHGDMPLDITASEPGMVARWFENKVPFHVELPNYPVGEGQSKRYSLVGARLLQYRNEDVAFLAYQMGEEPISLLMASTDLARPLRGDEYRSGNLKFYFSFHNGFEVISWTDRGLHYALVSGLGSRGAESCAICHGASEERHMIEGLKPSTTHQ